MIGSQGIFKGTVFLNVQRTTLLDVLCYIEVVNEVFLLYRFGNAIDLCVCLFIRIVAIDTDALMLLLIVNGSTVILESMNLLQFINSRFMFPLGDTHRFQFLDQFLWGKEQILRTFQNLFESPVLRHIAGIVRPDQH